MPLPIIAIVGRPNVGKSTLFNRILKKNVAVVDAQPGVTRDRHYATAEWDGFPFTLVDTGGYLPAGGGDAIAKAVREQTLIAAEEADLVLMTGDAQAASDDVERELARIILGKGTPAIFIANKVDDPSMIGQAYELDGLGLGEPFAVSAKNGYRLAELLDLLVARLRELKPVAPAAPETEELSLAIVGAPNSGKSSLVNCLAGQPRMIVTDIAGTTRDSVDTVIRWHNRPVRIIDSAGLRRKRFGQQGLEFYCTLRALRALEQCEVAVVLIDAVEGLSNGDIRLVDEAAEKGAGIIVAVNKWDAVDKGPKTADEWLKEWRRRAPRLEWAPVVFISALTGQRAVRVIELAFEIQAERTKQIETSALNAEIVTICQSQPPPAVKGKFVRVKYAAQIHAAPPKFAFFASHANLIPPHYGRFLEREIRRRYGFQGVPVRVIFRNK